MKSAIELLRSLGFGALLGGGVAGLLYSSLLGPDLSISIKEVIIIGGLIGAGAHRLCEFYISWILRPLSDFITYYSDLMEIRALCYLGILSEQRAQEIIDHLTTRRFLGRAHAGERLVPVISPSAQVNGTNVANDSAFSHSTSLATANPAAPADQKAPLPGR